MIVEAILYPIVALLEAVWGLWPTVTGEGHGPDPLAVRYLAGAQGVVDIAGPLSFLLGLLLVVPALLAVRALVYLYRLLPGKFS